MVTCHRKLDIIGLWFTDTGAPIRQVDFFGQSDRGQLQRVETFKPGMFWHVWAEYFPHADVNRTDDETAVASMPA